MSETQKISCSEAEAYGIQTAHSRMLNGELRFRLRCSDGTAYIRTVASESSGWQNSHYHERVRETYIVQKGRMGFVELIDGQLRKRLYEKDEVFTTQPMIKHNVYLFPNSVIHTVKHGEEGSAEDRIPAPDLDEMLGSLGAQDFLETRR